MKLLYEFRAKSTVNQFNSNRQLKLAKLYQVKILKLNENWPCQIKNN